MVLVYLRYVASARYKVVVVVVVVVVVYSGNISNMPNTPYI